ncbi:hypothetical protein [Kitasatospora azatica]|uniref:hypothetical protein n=1 Tax=Kitasatospora azatica TaxID=58347 RepID=UPI00056B6F5E|nr:hypothetical protein [Kitasatospora azatica]
MPDPDHDPRTGVRWTTRRPSYPRRLAAFTRGVLALRAPAACDLQDSVEELLPVPAELAGDFVAGRAFGRTLTQRRWHHDATRPGRLRDCTVRWPFYEDYLTVVPREPRGDCPACHGDGVLWDKDDPWLLLGECPCTAPLLCLPVPHMLRRILHRRRYGRRPATDWDGEPPL